MGKAAKVVRDRTCLLCKQELQLDAAGLKKHFDLCVRAARAGLILPGVSPRESEIQLVKLYD